MYLLFIWRVCSGFEEGKIHYEGHWKGWALEIETFLGLEMATMEASANRFCTEGAFKIQIY